MFKKTEWWQIGLGILFLAATFLRFFQFSSRLMFLGDQGRDVLMAYKILHGDLSFIGPMTSVGNFYLGPFYYYFIAPWLWLFHYSPLGPAFAVAVFSLLTIALLYYFSFQLTGSHTIAFFSSLIYATNPIVVEYSRFSWNPNLLPFMSLLFVYLTFLLKKKEMINWKDAFLIGAIYGLILQLHYLAGLVILLPFLMMWRFWFDLKKSLSSWISLILGAILIELPFFLFEWKHNLREVHNLMTTFSSSSSGLISFSPSFLIKSIPHLLLQFDLRFLYGFTFFLIADLFIWLSSRQKEVKKKIEFILLFSVVAVFSLAIYRGSLYDHYFAFVFFMPVLVFSLFWWEVKEKKFLSSLLILYSLVIISFNLVKTYNKIFKYPPNNQLGRTKKIVTLIDLQAKGQPFNFALLSENNYDLGYKYFFRVKNLPVRSIHQQLTTQLFVVCEETEAKCHPLGNPLWDIAAFGWAKIDKSWQVDGVTIYRLKHVEKTE